MRILYLADGRSPIALNWIRYFVGRGHEIHLISSTPCAEPIAGLASFHVIPLALSRLNPAAPPRITTAAEKAKLSTQGGLTFVQRLRHGLTGRIVMDLRYLFSSADVYRHIKRARALIQELNPELVHALRIPFEGILAALSIDHRPLLISVWGNDFTLFARRYRTIGRLTRKALVRTSALHCDCQRDLDLAPQWGFDPQKPGIVLPSSGGVQAELFRPGEADSKILKGLNAPSGSVIVINPRGFRAYVRTDTFFHSIPLILKEWPAVIFACPSMAGNPIAEDWVERLNLREVVRLLPALDRAGMADYFRAASITLSLTEHDGTPNTLLEAMASGCFPVAGDIESAREWIIDGQNGFLCDPRNPESVAHAVLRALREPALCQHARDYNLALISERADYNRCMETAGRFYNTIVHSQDAS